MTSSSRTAEGRKPSARYMGLILDGARAHALPDGWIAALEASELAVDERDGAARADFFYWIVDLIRTPL